MSVQAICCKRERWIVIALALVAMVLALLVSSRIYQHRPLTTDENSYLFQAMNFIEGRISRPIPEIPEPFFHKMIIMDTKAGWFSRYPPVHALWLTPGVLIGYYYLMSLIGAAVGILLTARIAKRLKLSTPFTAALLVASPFYIFMYGSLLSHTSGFILTAAMLLCYIRWQQDGRASDAALTGLFWGLLFLNRTYTALLLAIPFGVDASISFLVRRNLAIFKGCCAFASVSALFIALYRLYNKIATGSSRLPTFLMYDPSEGLGFGPRHTRGLVVNHSFATGLKNVWENLVLMDQWIWGISGGLVLVAVLSIIGWRKRWTPLLIAAPVFVWAGYINFWYSGLEHFRPVYFFETLLFVIIAAASGFDQIHKHLHLRQRNQALAACLIPMMLVLGGASFVRAQARYFYAHNRESRLVYEHIQSAPTNALVLLEGFERKPLGENMLNIKGLQSDPLVARANPFWNEALVSLFPEHDIFLLRPNANGLIPFLRREAAKHFILASQTLRQTGTDTRNPDGTSTRIATSEFGPGLMLFGRYPYLTPGNWRIRMVYSIKQVDENHPVLFELAADRGQQILHQISMHGTGMDKHADVAITIDALREIEPRVFYGGTGEVRIESIQIEQIAP
jgi:hypothetical protein